MPIGAFKLNAIAAAGSAPAGPRTARTITSYGNIKVSTAQSKFGGSSIAFDGYSDYFTTGTLDSGDVTGDMTIELFVRFNILPSSQTVDGGSYMMVYSSGSNLPYCLINDSSVQVALPGDKYGSWAIPTVSINTWYHLAIVRSSGTIKLYWNGTERTSFTNDYNWTPTGTDVLLATTANWGKFSDDRGSFAGYMDEIRVSKTARYTSNFTPTASAFSSDSNTLLLIHGDDFDGSTSLYDDNGDTIPTTNNAVTLNGSNQYYNTSAITTTATDTKFFTFATTFYWNSNNYAQGGANLQHLVNVYLPGGNSFYIWINGGRLQVDGGCGTVYELAEDSLIGNAWNNVVFYFDSSSRANCRIYINGVNKTLDTGGNPNNTNINWGTTNAVVTIGAPNNNVQSAGTYFNGRISQLYLHNKSGAPDITQFWDSTANKARNLGTTGTATGAPAPLIYHYGTTSTFATNRGTGFNSYTLTANNTPTSGAGYAYSSTPFTLNSVFVDDWATKLLMHFENAVTDDNASGRTATTTQSLNGAGSYRTDQKKFGTYALASTGIPGGWTTTATTALNPGTSDFTIEFWFRPCATGNADQVTMQNQSNGSVHIYINTDSGFIGFGKQNVSWDTSANLGGAIPANTWHHIAFVRRSTSLTIYYDGNAVGSYTNTENYTSNVWQFSMGGASGVYFYMDDFRISGMARYPNNFLIA
jgi:hypothetical protein